MNALLCGETSDGSPLGRWRRVDPRSVFRGDPPVKDGTQSVEATLVRNFMAPALGNQPDQQKARELASGYFRPWALGDGQ